MLKKSIKGLAYLLDGGVTATDVEISSKGKSGTRIAIADASSVSSSLSAKGRNRSLEAECF